jgi:hypothetical protein
MLEFLKGIFKKKDIEKVTVHSEELDSWFDAKVEDRLLELDGPVQWLYESVDRLRDQLRKQREVLLAASIKDEDMIEARVKSVVLGHRTNYCRELGIFLNNIEIPEDTDLKFSKKLNDDLQEALDIFAQQTHKSFQASQHLFHKQVNGIVESLKELSGVVQEFQSSLEKKRILLFEDIKKKIEVMKKEAANKRRLQQEIRMKNARLESASKQRAVREKEAAELRSSQEFKEYEGLLELRAHLVDQCAAIERDIVRLFLELDRALRKYEYSAVPEQQKIVQKYLKDPKEAIKNDDGLAIWSVLVQLKNGVSSLGLKLEQEQRLKETLMQQSEEKLTKTRIDYLKLLEEREILRKHIESSSVIARIKENEYKCQHFEEQIKRFETEISALDEELKKIDVVKIGKEVSEEISRALDVELTLRFED